MLCYYINTLVSHGELQLTKFAKDIYSAKAVFI